MSNTELSYLIKEILTIKQSIADNANSSTSEWTKLLINLVPCLITSITTIIIAYKIFAKTTKREREFKAENETKELNDTYRKLFGEFYSLYHAITDEAYFMNLNFIETKCGYAMLRLHKGNESATQEYKELTNKYEIRYNDHKKNVSDLNRQIMSNVGQYLYLNPDSTCRDYLTQYIKTSFDYTLTEKFHIETDKIKVVDIRDRQVKEAKKYIHGTISIQLGKIAECMLQKK